MILLVTTYQHIESALETVTAALISLTTSHVGGGHPADANQPASAVHTLKLSRAAVDL